MILQYEEFINEGINDYLDMIGRFFDEIKVFRNDRNHRPNNFEEKVDFIIGDGTYSKLFANFEKVKNSLISVDMDYLSDRFSSIIGDDYPTSYISLCVLSKNLLSKRKDDMYNGFSMMPPDILKKDFIIDWLMCDALMSKLYLLSKIVYKISEDRSIEDIMKYFSTPGIIMSVCSIGDHIVYPYDEVIDDFNLMIEVIKDEVDYDNILFPQNWDPNYHRYKKPEELTDYQVMISLGV